MVGKMSHVMLQNWVKNKPFYSCGPVTRPMNGSEAGGDFVLIQTSLFLSYKSCCCDANEPAFA